MHHLIISLLVLLAFTASADLRIPQFFGDHMVLQRDIDVPIWGWGAAGESVAVSFADQHLKTQVMADGTWMVKLAPMPASTEGRVLTIGKHQLNDVVVGEVWICSGQSNMDWRVAKSLNAETEIAAANHPGIRQLNIKRTAAYLPNTDAEGKWTVCSPDTVHDYTAVGYYFGRKLYQELNIPIGLIDASWGGTGIEPWISESGYRLIPELGDKLKELEVGLPTTPAGKAKWERYLAETEQWLPGATKLVAQGKLPVNRPKRPERLSATHHASTKIYNAVINPIVPYAIRGTIWYQGESSWGQGPRYLHALKGLAEGWRTNWDQAATDDRTKPGRDFPFYVVQLANLHPFNEKPEGGDGYAQIREAMRTFLDYKNTGIAVIHDIGNPTDIHPKNKQDVGSRLALWALAKDYKRDIVYSGPLYDRLEIRGNKAHIHFTNTGSGLMAGKKEGLAPTKEIAAPIKGFAIAGADKVWHWATATVAPDGKTLIVSSDKIASPAAVRYAYRWNPAESNLYNKEGLPAAPFRTDNW